MTAPAVRPGRSALALVLAGLAFSVWLVGSASDADALSCGPATSSRAAIAVVVDFGDTSPEGRCIAVARNSSGGTDSTGIDALRAAGHSLRIDGGFLCAIDGVPASGCARNSGFDGAYWRYFKAEPGGGWRYSSAGFGYRVALVNGCAAEGWVWSSAPDASVTPRGGVPSLNCVSQPSPTTTRVPVTSASPPPPTSPSAGAGAAAGGGNKGGAAALPADATPRGSELSPGGADDPRPGAGAGTDGPAVGVEPAEGPGGVEAQPDAEVSAEVVGADGEADGFQRSDSDSGRSESASPTRRNNDAAGGSGSVVGPILAGLIVAGLVLFATLRARSRRAVV